LEQIEKLRKTISQNMEFRDKLLKQISEQYPEYAQAQLLPYNIDIEDVQSRLASDEVIVDYILNKDERTNESELYVFLISRNKIRFFKQKQDAGFMQNLEYLRHSYEKKGRLSLSEFNETNKCLNALYDVLVSPINDDIIGRKIYVIPDEEIAYVSFDMLLTNYQEADFINYAGLPYLIKKDYNFSYSYALSMLFDSSQSRNYNKTMAVFAPEYPGKFGETKLGETKLDLNALPHQKDAIITARKWFHTNEFYGELATKDAFLNSLSSGSAIYYSGHAFADINEYERSMLTFSSDIAGEDIDFLFLNEISQLQINTPLVILSACKTGDGRLYSGEGVIHLTYAFMLAGAPATMHALWEIDSEADKLIMENYLMYLSKGDCKSEALRLAKLDYLDQAKDQNQCNPYFWAAYIPMGDDQPIAGRPFYKKPAIYLSVYGLFFIIGIFVFFRKKSKRKLSPHEYFLKLRSRLHHK